MGLWEKSLRIFKCLCENGRQGVRRIAQQTGLSKGSVHRLTQTMARRGVYVDPGCGKQKKAAVVDMLGRCHTLYVRPQARRRNGHHMEF